MNYAIIPGASCYSVHACRRAECLTDAALCRDQCLPPSSHTMQVPKRPQCSVLRRHKALLRSKTNAHRLKRMSFRRCCFCLHSHWPWQPSPSLPFRCPSSPSRPLDTVSPNLTPPSFAGACSTTSSTTSATSRRRSCAISTFDSWLVLVRD